MSIENIPLIAHHWQRPILIMPQCTQIKYNRHVYKMASQFEFRMLSRRGQRFLSHLSASLPLGYLKYWIFFMSVRWFLEFGTILWASIDLSLYVEAKKKRVLCVSWQKIVCKLYIRVWITKHSCNNTFKAIKAITNILNLEY